MEEITNINKLLTREKVTISKAGLVFSDDVTYPEWVQILGSLKLMKGAVHFWIGDALNYGEGKFGEQFSQVLDGLDYEYGTLQNDKWVSGRIPPSRRREKLTFAHHQEVADLMPEDQEKMLDDAESKGLNTKDFRAHVRRYKMMLDLPELKPEQLDAKPHEDFKEAQRFVMMLIETVEEIEKADIKNMNIDARDFLFSQIRKAIGKLGRVVSLP